MTPGTWADSRCLLRTAAPPHPPPPLHLCLLLTIQSLNQPTHPLSKPSPQYFLEPLKQPAKETRQCFPGNGGSQPHPHARRMWEPRSSLYPPDRRGVLGESYASKTHPADLPWHLGVLWSFNCFLKQRKGRVTWTSEDGLEPVCRQQDEAEREH